MEAKEYEELVKNVVEVVQMTCDHLNIPDSRDLRKKKASFVFEICGGLKFAFVRLHPDLALCFRSEGQTFFLAGAGDEMEEWAESASQAFASLKYKFGWRKPADLDTFLSTLQSLFAPKQV